MAMEAIGAALGTLKTAGDLLRGLNKLKNEAEILQAKSELLQLVYQAREDIFVLQAEQEALLRRFESGGLVYRFEPPVDSDTPVHDLCTHCYQHGIKSILQFSGYLDDFHKYTCPACAADVAGERVTPGPNLKPVGIGLDW